MASGGNSHTGIRAGIATSLLALLCSTANAQDSGGLEARLTFSQGLTYSDVDGTSGRTNLGFDLSSATRTQTLEFGISSGLEQSFDSGLSNTAINPRANLAYGIESRQTALTTTLSYRQSEADEFVADPNGAPEVLVLDEGTREDINAGLELAFGREARFGGSFDLGYSDTAYSETTSVALVDEQTTSAGVNLRFEIDRRITSTLGYNWSETDRANNRDLREESLSAGAQLAVTQTLDATVSLGLSRVTVTEAGVARVTEGLSYSLDLTQERPAGSLRFSLDSNLSEAGRRTTAIVGALFELPRGEFSTDVGLSEGSDNEIRPLLTLSYREDLPRGNYSVSLDQRFDTDADGDETLNSRLQLNWRQNLTRSSELSSNLSYQVTDVLGADEDAARLELGFTYSQDLTEDWALTTSYTHSLVDQDGEATRRENEIFVGLETSFGWSP